MTCKIQGGQGNESSKNEKKISYKMRGGRPTVVKDKIKNPTRFKIGAWAIKKNNSIDPTTLEYLDQKSHETWYKEYNA